MRRSKKQNTKFYFRGVSKKKDNYSVGDNKTDKQKKKRKLLEICRREKEEKEEYVFLLLISCCNWNTTGDEARRAQDSMLSILFYTCN